MSASACIVLSCLLMQELLMCMFVHYDSRCKQLSFCFKVQRSQIGEVFAVTEF